MTNFTNIPYHESSILPRCQNDTQNPERTLNIREKILENKAKLKHIMILNIK